MRAFWPISLVIGNPFPLKQNEGKSFQGSIVLGKGFVLKPEEAEALIAKNPRNKDVLFPYLTGDDLNNHPEQKASRWVINFFDWSQEKAKSYPDCFEIVERLVKSERQRWKLDENGMEIIGTYALRKPRVEKWWQYGERASALYETMSKLDQVMAINRHAKHWLLSFSSNGIVYSEATIVLAIDSYQAFAILSSTLHEIWAWKNSSTMGASTLRYSTTKAFETFPFPSIQSPQLEQIGKEIVTVRTHLTSANRIGLTDIQNQFHDQKLDKSEPLYRDIVKLRSLQRDLDHLVLQAYGWNDIQLKHDFYEVDYLPENDRIRFSIQAEVRREILMRLFELNKQLHADEQSEIGFINKSKSKRKNSTVKNNASNSLF